MARKPINYWERRSTELMKQLEKKTEYSINQLIEVYKQATKNINKEINNIFKNFEKDTELKKETLLKLLNSRETETHYKNLLEIINNDITDESIKKKLLAKYNAPAYSYRISRYQQLQDNIDLELKKLADIENRVTKQRYVDTIQDAYYHNIYEIQKGLGIGFSFSEVDMKTINLLLNEKWIDKGNFSTRIWENSEKLSNYLKTQFTADTITEMSIQKMSRQLADSMNVGLYNATRLVRTEVNHFANEGEMLSYEELDIEKYRFIATLDNVTCEHCAELDNKVFNVKDRKPGKNYPPIHANDRCTTVAEFADDTIEDLERRARDPITGKTYLVDQNTTYNEWKKQIDDKYGKGIVDLEHKKYTNLKTDKEQYKRYKKVLEKEFVPEKFEKFQDLKYNNIEEYNDLKGYYRYKLNYPESNREFYEINGKIQQYINLGEIKKSIGTAIKPNKVTIGTINNHALEKMNIREITKQLSQKYIDEAIIAFSQNTKVLYLSNKGATVLLKEDNRLITTYNTFDDEIKKILEVINGRKI